TQTMWSLLQSRHASAQLSQPLAVKKFVSLTTSRKPASLNQNSSDMATVAPPARVPMSVSTQFLERRNDARATQSAEHIPRRSTVLFCTVRTSSGATILNWLIVAHPKAYRLQVNLAYTSGRLRARPYTKVAGPQVYVSSWLISSGFSMRSTTSW